MIFFALVSVLLFAIAWVATNAYFVNKAMDAEDARNAEDKAIKAKIARDSRRFVPAGQVAVDHNVGRVFR